MRIHNLLSLPHLPTKQTKGKESSIDYSPSHVVTFEEYCYLEEKKTWRRQLLMAKEAKRG